MCACLLVRPRVTGSVVVCPDDGGLPQATAPLPADSPSKPDPAAPAAESKQAAAPEPEPVTVAQLASISNVSEASPDAQAPAAEPKEVEAKTESGAAQPDPLRRAVSIPVLDVLLDP